MSEKAKETLGGIAMMIICFSFAAFLFLQAFEPNWKYEIGCMWAERHSAMICDTIEN